MVDYGLEGALTIDAGRGTGRASRRGSYRAGEDDKLSGGHSPGDGEAQPAAVLQPRSVCIDDELRLLVVLFLCHHVEKIREIQ